MSLTHSVLMPTPVTKEIDRLYALRTDDAQSVRASISIIEQRAERNAYELLWRLSRARFFIGQCAAGKEEARREHRHGVCAGSRAARLTSSRVEGHFWMGVNLALRAGAESSLRAVVPALAARRALRRAIEIDPAYHAAGPLRVLARLESRLPALLGGNRTRALQLYERAIQLAPTNTVTRLYCAELLFELGDETQAVTQLRALLDAPLDPCWSYEIDRDKHLAQEMLRNVNSRAPQS